MNGNEEISLRFVGDVCALFQRDERVVRTRVQDFRARQALLNDFPQPQGDIETQILFHQTCRPDRARIVAAVARVDHNSSDFQA